MRPKTLPANLALSWQWVERVQEGRSSGEHGGGGGGHYRESSQSTTNSASSSPTGTSSHARSAASSLSSYPSHNDLADSTSSSQRKAWPALPDVAEEPIEREFPDYPASPAEHDGYSPERAAHWSHDVCHRRTDSFFMSYQPHQQQDSDFDDIGLDGDRGHWTKRRRSGESAIRTLSTRLVGRLPSLSRRSRDRKRSQTSMSHYRSSGAMSPAFHSRSASRATSYGRPSDDFDLALEESGLGSAATSADEYEPSPVLESYARPSFERQLLERSQRLEPPQESEESEEAKLRVSTPLLHPLMEEAAEPQPSLQSPLQSPTVAACNSVVPSASHTPAGTPPLSTKPSATSFGRSRPGTLIPSSEIPPMIIAENDDDPWAEKLGHANYQIFPEPYLPDDSDLASCRRLMCDWERARKEYSKQLARTETHFGVSSKVYRWTEEKWSGIDARWRANHDIAVRRARLNGETPPADAPTEPAPVAKIPHIDGHAADGKFPRLGDNDIVGPMTQAPGGLQSVVRRSSKRDRIKRFISGIRSPTMTALAGTGTGTGTS